LDNRRHVVTVLDAMDPPAAPHSCSRHSVHEGVDGIGLRGADEGGYLASGPATNEAMLVKHVARHTGENFVERKGSATNSAQDCRGKYRSHAHVVESGKDLRVRLERRLKVEDLVNNWAVFDNFTLVLAKGPGVEIISVFDYDLRAARGRAVGFLDQLSGLAKTLGPLVADLAQRCRCRLASRPQAMFQRSADRRAARGRAVGFPDQLSGLVKTLRAFVSDLAQRSPCGLASRPQALFQRSAAQRIGW
jgi:hypothetical protein